MIASNRSKPRWSLSLIADEEDEQSLQIQERDSTNPDCNEDIDTVITFGNKGCLNRVAPGWTHVTPE